MGKTALNHPRHRSTSLSTQNGETLVDARAHDFQSREHWASKEEFFTADQKYTLKELQGTRHRSQLLLEAIATGDCLVFTLYGTHYPYHYGCSLDPKPHYSFGQILTILVSIRYATCAEHLCADSQAYCSTCQCHYSLANIPVETPLSEQELALMSIALQTVSERYRSARYRFTICGSHLADSQESAREDILR